MILNGPRTPPKTLMTSSTMLWCSAGTSSFPLTGVILGMISLPVLDPLDPRIRVAPSVEIDCLSERPAADRSEPPHRITDRQNRIRMPARRDPHRRLRFLFVLEMPGGQR